MRLFRKMPSNWRAVARKIFSKSKTALKAALGPRGVLVLRRIRGRLPEARPDRGEVAARRPTEPRLQALEKIISALPSTPAAGHADAPEIAAIVSPGLAERLAPDARLVHPGENDWRGVLYNRRPQALLVEPCVISSGGDWHNMYLIDHRLSRLRELVEYARQKGIPDAIWITHDHRIGPDLIPVAGIFKAVFCDDPKAASLMRQAYPHKVVQALPLSFQPLRHNPGEPGRPRRFDVLINGIAETQRFPQQFDLLNRLEHVGVCIADTRFTVHPSRLKTTPGHIRKRVFRRVTSDEFASLLKSHKILLIQPKSLSLPIDLQRLALEAIACGTTVVSQARLEGDPELLKHIHPCMTPEETVSTIRALLGSDDREAAARAASQELRRDRTVAHALDRILLGLREINPPPSASNAG